MTTIKLTTHIKAPIEVVFNIARDISEHELSNKHTHEKAIAGITSGKIGLGETVTWRAKHFGIYFQHTSIISEFNSPTYFVDKMVKGVFKSMRHEHIFEEINNETKMTDVFTYEVPLGRIGKLFDTLLLRSYLTRFLLNRNRHLQQKATLT